MCSQGVGLSWLSYSVNCQWEGFKESPEVGNVPLMPLEEGGARWLGRFSISEGCKL